MFEKTIEDVYSLVEIAGTYIEDGAPKTAADRLRQAASILDELSEKQQAALAELSY